FFVTVVARQIVSLSIARQAIIACECCPRLREHCARVGREKRRAFRNDTYWARPVPGFGDPEARLLVLGLAPAAHGANRTGRGIVIRPKPDFTHGSIDVLPTGQTLLGCYHPSRQNTNTGRLTSRMMSQVFQTARGRLSGGRVSR